MIIGCPKERKIGEKRVSLTPSSVKELVQNNLTVLIEKDAGIGCGYLDEDYINNGAKIVLQQEVWEADLIIKVKEPQEEEYPLFKTNQIIFGFLHLAASPECVEQMQKKNITAIAAETIKKNGIFNLLKPVSQIAGRRALFVGLHYLETFYGGKGILLSGTKTIDPGNVLIIGGGEVGINAADMSLAIGCKVVIAEVNNQRIEDLKQKYQNDKVQIIKSTDEALTDEVADKDVIISTVLIPGAKAPKVLKRSITANISSGTVVVDVSADQGGTVEIMKTTTSHDNPIKIIDDVVYYAVPNMPGAVPKTASESIQGSVEYIIKISQLGVNNLAKEDVGFKEGIQIKDSNIVYKNLKESLQEEK